MAWKGMMDEFLKERDRERLVKMQNEMISNCILLGSI
jgi:hypothetical protein